MELVWHRTPRVIATAQNWPTDREEHLLQDCEWKLRSTEQKCKARVVAAEQAKLDALLHSNVIETEAKRQIDEVRLEGKSADDVH